MAAEQDAVAQTGGSDHSTAYALTPLAGTRSLALAFGGLAAAVVAVATLWLMIPIIGS